MYNYEYVSKAKTMPIKNELIDMFNEVQELLGGYFTFRYDFIGSSKYNMVTQDPSNNIGFDFDVNFEPNDDEEEYSAQELKGLFMKTINKACRKYGYDYCENSKRVITIKVKDRKNSRIKHSCDIAIVNTYFDNQGNRKQQYIHFNKNNNSYEWRMQPKGYCIDKKIKWIKNNGYWNDLRDCYLDKKNYNRNIDKHSRSLRAEAIKEICDYHGYEED